VYYEVVVFILKRAALGFLCAVEFFEGVFYFGCFVRTEFEVKIEVPEFYG